MHDSLRNDSAEKSILGLLMVDGRAGQAQCVRVRKEHFSLPSHQEIFDAICRVMERHEDCGYTLVAAELGKRLESVGGFPYLADLTLGIYNGFDPQPRIDLMVEAWKKRRGVTICDQYRSRLLDGGDATESLSSMQEEVFDAIADSAGEDDPCVGSFSDGAYDQLIANCDRSAVEMGLSYGVGPFDKNGSGVLDSFTGGMRPGEVTVVGADSGGGKTAILKQAVAANCNAGRHCTVFSLEMSRKSLLHGLWAIVSGVEYRKIRRPYLLNIEERAAVKSAYLAVKEWPLAIYDDPSMHINQIAAYARLERRMRYTEFVGLDYAQIAVADGRDDKERVSKVSRTITATGKAEGFHTMLLSQFRKAGQAGHKPTADDLAETRQLKNDAHVIMLIHRTWDPELGKLLPHTELVFPKVRDGETGTIQATFNKQSLTFEANA